MSKKVEPPGGLPFQEAFREFTDPDKYQAWEEAESAWLDLQAPSEEPSIEMRDTEWVKLLDPEAASKPEPKPDKQELRKAKQDRARAFAEANDSFIVPLRAGELVAFGFPNAKTVKGQRTLIAADLWGVLRNKSWYEPVFKGCGQVFHDVRFHREIDLKEWRRGASLSLALRSIEPLLWGIYQVYRAPHNAPVACDEEDRQYWGGYGRMELWSLLCEAVVDSEDYELRVLWPKDLPDTGWRAISDDRLAVFLNNANINIEKSEVTFPDAGAVPVRLFLRDAVSAPAPIVAEATSGQPGWCENVVPSAKAENSVDDSVHDAALELFGKARRSRGGPLGDVFAEFMHRHGNRLTTDHLLYSAREFVFDKRLPKPGVVPAQVYESEKDYGALLLSELRQGAATGLAFDEASILDGGHPASLPFTYMMVENQKWIDAGRRDGWSPGERLELRRQAWLLGGLIFMPESDDRGRPIHIPDDAWPIVFEEAWRFLNGVAIFNALLGVAAITMGARVPRDGTTDRNPLPSGIWHEQPMRLDLERNLLFVPTYDDDRPWVPRFEDMWLINRALHPELEAVHEITEPSHEIGADAGAAGPAPRSGTEPPRYVGNLRQKVSQACKELRGRDIEIGTATVYDELEGSGLDPIRETVRRYVSDYMKDYEPS